MPASRLETIRVEKPWGRTELWPGFAAPEPGSKPVGEIWFDAPGRDLPLLVKYLFTSERLSIQVHPDDDLAHASGHKHGKEECWVVLDAGPEARLGLGTTRKLSAKELRAAALSGEIETLMDWKPVKAGDVVLVSPGTVHAIGADVTLIEVQQNIDLTYRLYDYGRPRELHLDEGVAASRAEPFPVNRKFAPLGGDCLLLAQSRHFALEQWNWQGTRRLTMPEGTPGWLIPVEGSGAADGAPFSAGECWLVEGSAEIAVDAKADLLFAYPSPQPLELFV
jgi:mannose-6-phosphate isomerase